MSTEETNDKQVKETLRKLMKYAIHTISFEKQDGSIRKMVCTTNLDCIPVEHHPRGSVNKLDSGDVMRVYDLELEEWRSFRYSSILGWSVRMIQSDDIVNPGYMNY